MYFIKCNSEGVPIDFPKTYEELAEDYASLGLSMMNKEVFVKNSVDLNFRQVNSLPMAEFKPGKVSELELPSLSEEGEIRLSFSYREPTDEEVSKQNDLMRLKRNQILSSTVDRLSPIRWETMNDEDRETCRVFRQSLLDAPASVGWPFIEFPLIPSILEN